MKKTAFILFGSLITALTYGQTGGQLALVSGGNRVSNSLTGMLVKSNELINVLIYAAPDGNTNEG